ncbi:MAG: phospholipase D family protein [candidate division WOR-3 bacterium]
MTRETPQGVSHVRVLYAFRELAAAVKQVLSTKQRRLVISAFVGEGALNFLPRPRNTTLVCWPQPPGTNPAAVSSLVKAGVKVFFADNLHIKLYYGKGRGVVLSSANLSRNGLGGGLREIGVLLPPDAVDPDRVLSSRRLRAALS